ncbi:efflux RND transporter periplasmic adaptor subunit [Pedobacter insulae]|uniref:RND family efflux transporter, MFP subunit n=1 Tax=Pedobacter insulae TaxID=414048 RepID=A0A1I2YDN4_9SPHI|nr:efflux RND transporter periplasmic adaptor subunit [Pedobacter insulae]SFH23792.1 RND family efflux transporter, MFP subunit [Pedobacter insulae]
MKRIITTLVILVIVIGGIAYVLGGNKKKNQEKTDFVAKGNGSIAVNVAMVSKTVPELDFNVNGTFIPNKELNFLSENAGRVKAVYVEEGARVSKGQVLARIDAEIINTDRETAEAAYQNALKDEARYQSSYATGGVTQQQLDQAKLTTKNARLRLQASSRRLSDANIKSPINGIVNKKYIEVGSFVTAQGTQLFELVDVSKLKLKVNVNESQVANLKVGDKVAIQSTVYPDEQFTGKISFIAAKADGALNFPIEIEVANNIKNSLRAGMYGTAVFDFPKQASSILIPRTSFVGSVSSNQVFVLDKASNTAKIRKVVSGRILGEKVEILSGLTEGETVITSGQINLVDNTPVSIVK